MLRTESVRYSNTMAAAALRELTGFRELLLEMPPKSVFREPNNVKEEKYYLDSCIPKATRYATKWAYKVFGEWQSSRGNKDANFEETGFEVELGSIVEMSAESLNFWLTKFVSGVCKGNGERYLPRGLYGIYCGLQRP